MKVTVCFDNIRVVVPCGDGTLLVRDLMHEAILRYKKATGKNDSGLTINSLSSLTGGGLLDPDDRLCDVADDREQIVAHFIDMLHVGGDGASSIGTNSPDFFHSDNNKEHHYGVDTQHTSSIKRESTKRLSMHALSTREPCLTTYSAQSLPRESRRKEPLGEDAKSSYEFAKCSEPREDVKEILIKNEAGPLGLHVVPCYDLLGNDQGLRVEGIEPNGRIAKDGQIDLHDRIIKINGHNLLHIPFSKVQEIFRNCMNESCLRVSVLKYKKHNNKSVDKNTSSNEKTNETDDNVKRLQCSNYNILQTANTRKIGKMIEIELTKGTNGLGFSVTTRDNPAGGHCPIYIKNILPKGAAVEDGRLRPGDRLLEVNKMEMTGKSQAEVVSLLRSIPPGGKVRMVVSRQEDVSPNVSETQSNSNVQETENSKYWNTLHRTPTKKSSNEIPEKSEYEKCSYKNVRPSDEIVLSPRKNRMILTLDIPVHDSEKAGLGVSVKGKTSNNEDNTNMDLGIFIKSVLHGGAASRDGRLRTNDQLLNVNGVSLLGLSNSDAMETLRRAMLNTNSSVTGVITLTIARRVSSYNDNSEKNFIDNLSSQCQLESANSVFISDTNQTKNIKEKNNINSSQTDILDNNGILSCATASPWNPVIDRLTEQYNKNSLRNESYCIATNKTWIEQPPIKKLGQREDRLDSILLEDSNENNLCNSEIKRNSNEEKEEYSGDPTYDSQLSLEEFNSSVNKFSRDALGRQSMSEKRHAALDAKNTDTYKRNKKLREGRDNKNVETNQTEKNLEVNKNIEGSSSMSENNHRKHSYEKSIDSGQPEYMYTIPGCNKKFLSTATTTLPSSTSPRKHWLVDDVNTGDIPQNHHFKEEQKHQKDSSSSGFSNARGDVKQASLNSALDDRYKRSRKKGGIRSMLRLGKNRKSLNFGDNIEARHESTFQSIPRQLYTQQKRYRGKINIQKPKAPHHERAKVLKFIQPVFKNPFEGKTYIDVCQKANKVKRAEVRATPYEQIIARECLNWYKNSRMIAFLHTNSLTMEDQFDFRVKLKKANMYAKYYGRNIMRTALKDTPYEAVQVLFTGPSLIVFSPDTNVPALAKILKKTPQIILLAGVLDGKFLHLNDFLHYGSMDLTTARAGLVQVLQNASGGNLNRQLTHHQSTLVSRLKQIGNDNNETGNDISDENKKDVCAPE